MHYFILVSVVWQNVSLHMGSWQDSVLYLIVKYMYMGEKIKLGNGIMMKIIQIYKLNKVMYIT